MNSGSVFVSFLAGAAIGSVATWFFVKKYYEKINQEDAAEVRAFYSKNKFADEERELTEEEKDALYDEVLKRDPADVAEYGRVINEQEYSDIVVEDDLNIADKPYIISPEEFGNEDGYTVHDLTFYADKILTDEDDRMIADVESLVGWESLSHIGEFMPDIIHVRNERLKTDFEISRDLRNYKDVLRKEPFKADI